MDTKQVKKGDIIAKKDTPIDNLWYITDGTVVMDSGSYKLTLKKGDFIGIADFDTGLHSYHYYVSSDAGLMNFSTRENLYNTAFYTSKPDNCRALALSLNRMLRESYTILGELCATGEELSKMVFELYSGYCEYARELHSTIEILSAMDDAPDPISLSINQKMLLMTHKGMYGLLASKETSAGIISGGVAAGYMLHSINDLHEVSGAIDYIHDNVNECLDLLMNESEEDLYGRLGNLALKATPAHPLYATITGMLERIAETVRAHDPELAEMRTGIYERRLASMGNDASDGAESEDPDTNASSRLVGSMNTILEFASYPEDKAAKFKEAVNAFKKVGDPFSSEDEVRRLRKVIEEDFYQLYPAVLQASLATPDVPVIIKMFLNFGYLDEELCGMKNACELYHIAMSFSGDRSKGVYTASEWLTAILKREKEPSINEFEQNYADYIKEQVTNGRISEKQSRQVLDDPVQKMIYEVQNMFRRTSKMCSGQILSFCPILSDFQLIRGPKSDLLDPDTVYAAIDAVKKIDYSLFYRETMCVFSEKENIHDVIHVEVMPDIILMPVAGTRGTMWQEIAGRDRTTPGRLTFPVINSENLEKIVIRVLGAFRWEMCKRMQGMRWNDVTDPSLTSLYCDYLQFYRKNSEVSPEQKEKIKLGLQRYKQNFKEYFINDYTEYIRYESAGSPHLNKIARGILFSQCPFAAVIRDRLGDNPIYSEVSERYRLKTGQQLHKLDNIVKKLNSRGQPVTIELRKEIEFYNM